MVKFRPLSINGLPPLEAAQAVRLNCLGSLYYFIKVALRRHRLTEHLHQPICDTLERQFIKDVYELPRDHFKSTICSEGLPMWWALPLSQQDIDHFVRLGYPTEYLEWMLKAHDPNVRVLLVSENITNAAKLGKRIRWHFESNSVFRGLFPEILPTTNEVWTNYSLEIKRPSAQTGGSHGEGTFDFLGVGSALQSRHYGRMIEDDLVGRKAIESPSVMDTTIDYHRLLVGAFESEDRTHENSELLVGNRWGYHDLNSHVKENETWFTFSTHGALGGCCNEHPPDQPIFPEEFSFEKLMRLKARLGSYHFSCQFLNNPVAPEDADFQENWLNYFSVVDSRPGEPDSRVLIKHEVKEGVVRKDVYLGHLQVAMTSDPTHSGNAAAGRCRHAIIVVGLGSDGNYYLLDAWARHATYDTYINEIYHAADRWRLRRFGLETIAAQNYLAYHIQYRNMAEGRTLKIVELKGEVEGPDGQITRKKEWRIRNIIQPIAEQGRLWIQRKHQDFLGEFTTFPRGRYCDLLDAFAYVPQMLRHSISFEENSKWLRLNQAMARQVNRPYSVQ